MPAKQKSPLLAAIGSFIIPGLGQVYNGEGFLKGLLYIVGTFIGSIIFVLPGLAIWLYGVYNAYKVANQMNLGQIPYKGSDALHLILYVVLVFVIEFIVVFLIMMFSAVLFALIFAATGGSSSSY